MLQRNNRDGTFSDIGQLAGVARTDWSWSALIADFDLDGRKDIFVTNGIAKDLTSQDYVAHLADPRTMQEATNSGKSKVDFSKLIAGMTSTPLPNYAFRTRAACASSTRPSRGGWTRRASPAARRTAISMATARSISW